MPHSHDLEQEIRDLLDLTKPEAFPAETPWYVVFTTWFEELGDAIHAVAQEFQKGDVESLSQPATEAALAIWDSVIVPIDVPNVPFLAERMVEGWIRSAIPGLVESAFSHLKGDA